MTITSAEYIISSPSVALCPKTTAMEFAFIGRSNVGKSSLINMLTGRKALAKTSQTPGKTAHIIHFEINHEWYLVDLPGYGYARRSQRQQEDFQRMIDDYILQRRQMACLFLLIDVRHEPQRNDLDFMAWLGENGVPFAIVFTKADKLSRGALQGNVSHYLAQLAHQWDPLPPHFVTSSLGAQGRDDVLGYIDEILAQKE